MSYFQDFDSINLTIDRMVFHLVGPRDEHFVRLEEIRPGRFAPFFLDRVRSVSGGIPYLFSDASATRERLARIAADERQFQSESERLAADFQRRHGGSTAPGAFLLFYLASGTNRFFALLKYDDETVLTYDFVEGVEGRKRVTLDALERTFVQNKSALQKAALIRLTRDGGELVVLDRQNQQKVARYFEGFLDATRVFENAELTAKLVEVTRAVIRENRELVPEEVFKEVSRRTYEAAAAGGAIDFDRQVTFLEMILGQQLAADSPLAAKFASGLRKARIDSTPITLDVSSVTRPTTRKLTTSKNIQIRVPIDVSSFVKVEKDRIIINDRVTSDLDDAERHS